MRESLHIVGSWSHRLWGLSSGERLRRQVACAGGAPVDGDVLMARADMVLDQRLVDAMLKSGSVVLTRRIPQGAQAIAAMVPAAQAEAAEGLLRAERLNAETPGFRILTAEELAGSYNPELRKQETPYILSMRETPRADVEKRMFRGSYKGVTDIVTKYVWPWPARHATRWAAAAGLTPNMVTTASLALVVLVFYLFWRGSYGAGLVAAWGMCFLDTVDGKLARVTHASSKWGNVYDHGIDLIHPPFWWWAWWAGLAASAGAGELRAALDWSLLVVLFCYVADRAAEGVFLHTFKMQVHVWRRADSMFRLISARRNPNLVILSAAVIAGRPDLGLITMAGWTAASLLIHTARIGAAFYERSRSGALRSWLESPR